MMVSATESIFHWPNQHWSHLLVSLSSPLHCPFFLCYRDMSSVQGCLAHSQGISLFSTREIWESAFSRFTIERSLLSGEGWQKAYDLSPHKWKCPSESFSSQLSFLRSLFCTSPLWSHILKGAFDPLVCWTMSEPKPFCRTTLNAAEAVWKGRHGNKCKGKSNRWHCFGPFD